MDNVRRAGRALNYTVIFFVGLGLLFVAVRIGTAFASGRVAEILESYR
jgi:hypothetical protein